MVYFTGDIHGDYSPLVDFYNRIHPTMNDVIILLGDVGLNFYGGRLDKQMKIVLNDLDTTFFCIHGVNFPRDIF